MTPSEATQFMAEIFAMWTDPDIHARRAVIQTHFHESVHFYDRDGEFIGHEGLESFSDSLQSRFPRAQFTLAQPPQTLGSAIRTYWHFGPPDNPHAVSGMDFLILQGSKVGTLYAFVDENS